MYIIRVLCIVRRLYVRYSFHDSVCCHSSRESAHHEYTAGFECFDASVMFDNVLVAAMPELNSSCLTRVWSTQRGA